MSTLKPGKSILLRLAPRPYRRPAFLRWRVGWDEQMQCLVFQISVRHRPEKPVPGALWHFTAGESNGLSWFRPEGIKACISAMGDLDRRQKGRAIRAARRVVSRLVRVDDDRSEA